MLKWITIVQRQTDSNNRLIIMTKWASTYTKYERVMLIPLHKKHSLDSFNNLINKIKRKYITCFIVCFLKFKAKFFEWMKLLHFYNTLKTCFPLRINQDLLSNNFLEHHQETFLFFPYHFSYNKKLISGRTKVGLDFLTCS